LSSYLVLARKYRPKQFTDIVGQQSVVRTLVNAIKLKRTHQAYVFSGSRGIGKTSIARIFSKALRCENVIEKDGLLFSCDKCSDCLEIAAGNSVNVLEIDGASNNGVDAVREIREGAKFLPTSGLYKIYIIDEVHMLSTAAFNALLKTLEEPPEHVVFIFATTESHKIPETILGRCQRFDFKRVTIAQISQRMKEVLAAEKIDYEEASINLIARTAEGSMRDALSILDQVISFSSMKVTAQAVRESIGLIGTELVFALLKNILDRNAKEALVVVQAAFTQGVDLKVLMKVLIEMLHALILMQVGIEKPETNFNDDELKQIATIKTLRPLEENELIFQVFHHGLDLLSRAAQPKLIFDLLVVKTALAEEILQVSGKEPSPPRGEARPLETAVAVSPIPAAAVKAAPIEIPIAKNSPAASPTVPQVIASAVSAAPAPNLSPSLPTGTAVGSLVSKSEVAISAPISKSWEGFIDFCFEQKPVFALILEAVVEWTLPLVDAPVFKIGFREKDKLKADQLSQKSFKEQMFRATEEYFGFKVTPEVYFSQFTGESVAEKTERVKKENKDLKLQAILKNEVVQEAKALFGADLTNIEVSE